MQTWKKPRDAFLKAPKPLLIALHNELKNYSGPEMRGEQLEVPNSRPIIFQIFSSLQVLNFNTKAAKIMLKNPPSFAFPSCCIRFVPTSNKNFLCKNSQVAGFKKQTDFPVAWKGSHCTLPSLFPSFCYSARIFCEP